MPCSSSRRKSHIGGTTGEPLKDDDQDDEHQPAPEVATDDVRRPMGADRDSGQARHHDHQDRGYPDQVAERGGGNDARCDEVEHPVEEHRAAGVAARKAEAIGKLSDRDIGRDWTGAVEEELQTRVDQAQWERYQQKHGFGEMPRHGENQGEADSQQRCPRKDLTKVVQQNIPIHHQGGGMALNRLGDGAIAGKRTAARRDK